MNGEQVEPIRLDAHRAAQTFDCRVPDCPDPARSDRGMYAYLCDRHTAVVREGRYVTIRRPDGSTQRIGGRRRAISVDHPAPAPEDRATELAATDVVDAAKRLQIASRELDRARARVEPLLRHYEGAKRAYLDALDRMPR